MRLNRRKTNSKLLRDSATGLAIRTVVLAASTAGASPSPDLASVLAGERTISTYYNLIKQYPDFLLGIPNYSGVTIIAPNNDAFNKSQEWNTGNHSDVMAMLDYHLIRGTFSTNAMPQGPTIFSKTFLTNPAVTNVTGGQLVRTDKQPGNDVVFTSGRGVRSELVKDEIVFAAGLIQIVDTIMIPPARLESTGRDYREMNGFLGAVYAAGLIDELSNTKDITIFAPRNAAFQRVAGALSGLSRDALAKIIRYHVVTGQVLPSSELTNGTLLDSNAVDGNGSSGSRAPLRISRSANNLYVEAAQIVQPDVMIANGMVHIIGDVLNPEAAAMRPNPTGIEQAPAFPQTGATSTGVRVSTPYVTAIPCTSDCPATTASSSTITNTNATHTGVSSTVARVQPTGKSGGASLSTQWPVLMVALLLAVISLGV